METPLTPLEFARRACKLYPDRVAVVDRDSSWTYLQFLDRCDRWSAVLQQLGIKSGDRIAYLSPNTHAQLESFYAVPQIGAVLVPLNYRLTADDFVYLINHSGSRMVCADKCGSLRLRLRSRRKSSRWRETSAMSRDNDRHRSWVHGGACR